jgi:hypothetical protein
MLSKEQSGGPDQSFSSDQSRSECAANLPARQVEILDGIPRVTVVTDFHNRRDQRSVLPRILSLMRRRNLPQR